MERVVAAEPSLASLYARALLHRRRGGGDPSGTTVVLPGARFDVDRVAAFCRSTGFPLRDTVPLPYPHLLGFPLQVDLMVREPFPFAVLGLVHTGQVFDQRRPLAIGEPVDVSVRAVAVAPHHRGATVDLLTQVRAAGTSEPVWTGRSRYLARGVTVPGRPVEVARLPAPQGEGAVWRVPAGTGRAYAAVSGDVNPLHLSRATARLLGFRRALAHGMWTASRSLAALAGPAPQDARFEVEFGAPLLLPATVRHVVQQEADGWRTAVRSRDGARVHLAARLSQASR